MAQEIRRLYRSRRDSRLAGVCAGLGEFFEIDPVLVRLGWMLVTIFTGFIFGILAYALAWVIIPEEPRPAAAAQPTEQTHQGPA